MKTTAALMLLSFAALGAQAQTVYRCGSTYSDAPCPQSRVVDAADPRTDAQRADSLRVTADQKRLGREMEHDRVAMAAAQKPGGAASLSGTATKPADHKRAKHATRAKWIKVKKTKSPADAQV